MIWAIISLRSDLSQPRSLQHMYSPSSNEQDRVWPPAGHAVLCDTVDAPSDTQIWDVAGSQGGRVVAVPGPGLPTVWLATATPVASR
jgi:hypothetical protein